MLSKLMTGVWRFLCDGFTARGGRYWLARGPQSATASTSIRVSSV